MATLIIRGSASRTEDARGEGAADKYLLVANFQPATHRETTIGDRGVVGKGTAHQARRARALLGIGIPFRKAAAAAIEGVEVEGSGRGSNYCLQWQPHT